MRPSLALSSATALALALLIGCHREPRGAPQVEALARGPIAEVVSATGEVSALVTVSVGTQVASATGSRRASRTTSG